jgi:hypothetical protein
MDTIYIVGVMLGKAKSLFSDKKFYLKTLNNSNFQDNLKKGDLFFGDINLLEASKISELGGFIVKPTKNNEQPKVFLVKKTAENAEIEKCSNIWLISNNKYKNRKILDIAYKLEANGYKFPKVSRITIFELPRISQYRNILENSKKGDVVIGDFLAHQINALAKKGVTCYQINSESENFNIYDVEEVNVF